MQIVHIREPIIDPETFIRSYHNPSSPDGPVNPIVLACVLAWGAKFSEHPLIVADRQHHSKHLTNGRQRCRLAQLLASRAMQVLETDKVWRIATLANIQALVLFHSLHGGYMTYPDRTYRNFFHWLSSSFISMTKSLICGVASLNRANRNHWNHEYELNKVSRL